MRNDIRRDVRHQPDGVDIALIEQDDMPQLVASLYLPMPEALRAEPLALSSSGADELARRARGESVDLPVCWGSQALAGPRGT